MSALMPPAADAGSPAPLSAAQRLAESRERMRLYMLRGEGRHEARRRRDMAHAKGEPSRLIDKLRAMPGVGVLIDAIEAWWSNHPLRPMVTAAEDVVRETAAPLARRHPILLVTGAFAAGVVLVRYKPWRLLGKTALFAGFFSQITTHLITQMPWESVVDAITAFARKEPRHDEDSHAEDSASMPANEPAASEEMAGMKEAA